MNDMDGWIKLHRKFLNWEWFDNSEMVRFFVFLLLNCNHQDNIWQGITIKRGQYLTSIDKLSKKLSLTNQNIRTMIKKLKMSKELTSESTSKYSLLTLVNYDTYQSDKIKTNKQTNFILTNKQQTTNKQTNNKQEDKNDKNEKNTLLQNAIKEKYPNICKMERQLSFIESEKLTSKYTNTEIKEILEAMENYKLLTKKSTSVYLTIINWMRRRDKDNKTKFNKEPDYKPPYHKLVKFDEDGRIIS